MENGNREENRNEEKGDNETDSQDTNMYLEEKYLVDTHKIDERVIIKETKAKDKGGSIYCEESRNQESNFIYLQSSRQIPLSHTFPAQLLLLHPP